MFRANFISSSSIFLVAACFSLASLATAEDVNIEFGFQEFDWSDPTTLEFRTTPIVSPGNSWGNEEQTDVFVETGDAADMIDAFIPGSQLVRDEDIIVAQFESRFLTSANNHSYLAFGGDADPENSLFFGHGGGKFHFGTGTEFDLAGSTPTGVSTLSSFSTSEATGDGTISNDTRVGVRIGFDVANSQVRNFQVDSDNDGRFDQEFIGDNPISIDSLSPLDWFLVTYAGAGESRADNVRIIQQETDGDYNADLDFNQLDANIMCTQGIIGQNAAFDYNGDGNVDLADVNEFAFDNGGLPADMDFNGAVEFSDFLVLSGNFGQPGTYEEGDVSCNGLVDFADFLLLSTFFGSATNAQPVNGQALHAVPEPSSRLFAAQVLAVLVCGLTTFRRKR